MDRTTFTAMRPRKGLRRRLLGAAVTALAALAVLAARPAPAVAQSGERIVDYNVGVRIDRTGDLLVTEDIDYDFGGAHRHGIFRDLPVRARYDDKFDRRYPVGGVFLDGSPGTPVQFEEQHD